MFKNLFILSCLVFATLLSGVGNAEHSGLTIEGPPAITCDHMGTYTKRTRQNGTSTWSHPIANVARATSAGVVDGLGWASINIDGTVNGRKGSSTLSYRIGTWGENRPLRWTWDSDDHTSERKVITSYITGPTSTAEGTYNWDATGYVEGTPYYYSHGWQAGTKSKITGSTTGDWKVVYKKVCPSCGKDVDYFTQHSETCTGCGATIWKCTAKKLKAANSYGAADGWAVGGTHHWPVRCGRCSQYEWECARGNAVSTHEKKCSSCGERYWYCTTAAAHTCTPTNGGGGGSTPPATTPSTGSGSGGTVSTGGGSGRGDSGSYRTCIGGHRYGRNGDYYHRTRTCTRSGCGQTFSRCTNAHRGSNPCRFNRRGWHTDS